jgi:hypothetical protein
MNSPSFRLFIVVFFKMFSYCYAFHKMTFRHVLHIIFSIMSFAIVEIGSTPLLPLLAERGIASTCHTERRKTYRERREVAIYCTKGLYHTFCPYAGNIFVLKALDSNKKMENIYKIWYVCRSRSYFQRFFSG